MTPYKKAQDGRAQIEQAILDLLAEHADGLRNIEIADKLGLKSSPSDAHKNYLTWALLGSLAAAGKLEKIEDRNPIYRLRR